MPASADIDSDRPSERAPFVALLCFELRRAFGWRQVIGLAAVSLMGVVLAFRLPSFPDSVLAFFQRVFQLPYWPEIVVANDLTGIVFFVYWLGVFDVLTIYVVPLEERYLDLYLSKPLSRRAYMLARVIPVIVVVTAVGASSALAHWLALRATGLTYPISAFMGAAAVVVAWTACLVSVANLVILSARDTYTAAVAAFVILAVSILPGSIYMYRPDLFAGAPLARAILVFPLTLVWHPDFAAHWAIWLAVLLLGLAVAVTAVAGQRIESRDVR